MINTKCGLCGDEKTVLDMIDISRLTDLAALCISGVGYACGSPEEMQFGMALYQLNNGSRVPLLSK